ncbi:MAG: insulinase family protein [Candidatus Cloacimonetes bacterium]|nr:insulinase family protein [Candidatus Cloacimonadota bacterium]
MDDLRKVLFLMSLFMIFSGLCLNAGNYNLSDSIPVDDAVKIGKLENGLTYYIKRNNLPENFAELRLVVKAGSVLEDDDQAGLAHFTEHMAFNGTKNFPNNTLVEYLNTVGSGYSGGLNAFTSFDETVYMLSSRTDDAEQLDKSFLILSDWADRLSFDYDEIDSERGVIVEEWRGGRGANERMGNKQREVLFANSKYAERMPIGTLDVIENFDYQRIKDFYNDWYRPDLQAVVAVGDFEVEDIEALIVKYFSNIEMPKNVKERPYYTIPEHNETLYSFVTDKEATHTIISVVYKHPTKKIETIADYREELITTLLNTMLNVRFSEISRSAESPFLFANAAKYNMVAPLTNYNLFAQVEEDSVLTGYNALFTEIERVKQHGFYQSELLRAKDMIIRDYEKAYLEQDKTNSNRSIWSYVYNFLRETPCTSEKQAFDIVTEILPTINLDDIHNAIDYWMTEKNKVVTLMGIDKPDFEIPEVSEVEDIFNQVKNKQLQAYKENLIEEPLLAKSPQKVKVKKANYDKKNDLYQWKLKNGATVYLKNTDYKNNEILFSAFRKGGLSTADDDMYLSAKVAAGIIMESGIGSFDKTLLDKYLSAKDVNLRLDIRAKNESLSGRSSVKDIETMFQMMWLYFNEPRKDDIAFDTWKRKTHTNLANVSQSPEYTFNDSLYSLLYDNHLRSRQLQLSDIVNINLDDAYSFFRQRFGSVDGFNFIFVGNLDKDTLHSFIETYIATLPKGDVVNQIIDKNIRYNQNKAQKNVFKGQDEKSLVRVMYTNDYKYDIEDNVVMTAANSVLFELLLENIREKISGVYSIYPYPSIENKPYGQIALHIAFGCDPNRVDEILEAVDVEIAKIKNNEFDEKYLDTFKNTYNKKLEVQAKTNNYWLDKMEDLIFNEQNFKHFHTAEEYVNKIMKDDVANMMKRYINFDKKLVIILYPENYLSID